MALSLARKPAHANPRECVLAAHDRGFWAPRPGGEWKRGPRGLRYVPARTLPDGCMAPKKKLADKFREVENVENEDPANAARPPPAQKGLFERHSSTADSRKGLSTASRPVLAAATNTNKAQPANRKSSAGRMPGYEHARTQKRAAELCGMRASIPVSTR